MVTRRLSERHDCDHARRLSEGARWVFLVGTARSGTTWLQEMLGSHEEIVSPQETTLFHRYFAPWWREWVRQSREVSREWRGRHVGLPTVLTSERFTELLRGFAAEVAEELLRAKPTAQIILIKDPRNSSQGDLIRRVLPEASFIHLIRDGRDVVASVLAASRSWAPWAPGTARHAAGRWVKEVSQARAIAKLGSPYLEVRYEQLLERDPKILRRLLEFCGASATDEACTRTFERFSMVQRDPQAARDRGFVWSGEAARRSDPKEPEGFFRKGKSGSWADELSRFERWEIDRIAGDLLIELGYAHDRGWGQTPILGRTVYPVRSAGRRAIRRLRAAGAELSA